MCRDYFAIWEGSEVRQADGRYARYELVSCRCVDTYVRLKGNQNQICWKWRKVRLECAVSRRETSAKVQPTSSVLRTTCAAASCPITMTLLHC